MNIHSIVERTVKKYKTRSPYELADCLGIIIHRCPLGTVRGYYLKKFRIKQIVLNCALTDSEERFVLAHELGHAIMHENLNTTFLMDHTLFSKNKFEREANTFAVELLVPDTEITENPDLTLSQLARMTGYTEELLQCKGIFKNTIPHNRMEINIYGKSDTDAFTTGLQ